MDQGDAAQLKALLEKELAVLVKEIKAANGKKHARLVKKANELIAVIDSLNAGRVCQ